MVRRLHVPLLKPEDVIPHLAKQEAHWRIGYSAQELAAAWSKAGSDFSQTVRKTLNTAPEYVDAEFVDGFFNAGRFALLCNAEQSPLDMPLI
jgi:hypothetical protein